MLIAGFQKMSMMDYPKQPCCVIFTPYCNMDCVYCHNYHILKKDTPLIDEDEVFSFLRKRKGMLRAVTISGGEPTLQPNLIPFIQNVKAEGYLVKLDTNGSRPDVLSELLRADLLDYIAMDIKTCAEQYPTVTRSKVSVSDVQKSILLLRNYGVAHEFRTTFAPQISREDILEATDLIEGCETYYLQQYRKRFPTDPEPHLPSYVQDTADAVRSKLGVCIVRGI